MLRKIGYSIIRLILLIRNYGFKVGFGIWVRFIRPFSQNVCIKSSIFKNPVWLRKNDSDLDIFDQIFTEKQYEWYEIHALSPKVIIDAGANIGLSAIFFSNLFPDAKIYCIEPGQENHALLLKNTVNYPNITVLNGALWAKHEFLELTNPEGFSAGHAFSSSQAAEGVVGYTMDELIQMYSLERIDILKMDIEGAEKEIFEAEDLSWLEKVNILVIELHDMYRMGTSQPFIKAINGKIEKMYFKGENIICYFS